MEPSPSGTTTLGQLSRTLTIYPNLVLSKLKQVYFAQPSTWQALVSLLVVRIKRSRCVHCRPHPTCNWANISTLIGVCRTGTIDLLHYLLSIMYCMCTHFYYCFCFEAGIPESSSPNMKWKTCSQGSDVQYILASFSSQSYLVRRDSARSLVTRFYSVSVQYLISTL